jgi:hypothetical protein
MASVGDIVIVSGVGTDYATAIPVASAEVGDDVILYTLGNGDTIAVPRLTFGLDIPVWVSPNFDFAGFNWNLDFNFNLIPLISSMGIHRATMTWHDANFIIGWSYEFGLTQYFGGTGGYYSGAVDWPAGKYKIVGKGWWAAYNVTGGLTWNGSEPATGPYYFTLWWPTGTYDNTPKGMFVDFGANSGPLNDYAQVKFYREFNSIIVAEITLTTPGPIGIRMLDDTHYGNSGEAVWMLFES